MTELLPLETLLDTTSGRELPLPPVLADLYGRLRFPTHPHRAHVVGNFVSTLDGVVSLGIPGKASGREISGDNPHDRLVMGLLRAAADTVIVGAGTFRASSRRRWTADAAYPALADAFRTLRTALGEPQPPLNVVVTARGDLDLQRPPGGPAPVPLLVVTTDKGAGRLRARRLPSDVEVVHKTGPLTAARVLELVSQFRAGDRLLVEAGPQLMGDFIAEACLDELFLTIAPQIAGRDEAGDRPGFVAGKTFAPDDPRWATLVGLKRAGSHLFARYALGSSTLSTAPRTTAAG